MNLDTETRLCIRVLVVDDSAFMRHALSRMISSEFGLEVVGTASGGREALGKIASLDPDVVTLDVQMPGLGGLETLRCIMAQSPRPVIMVSAVTEQDAEITLDALGAGAFDYVPKHLSSASLDILHIRQDLVAKIWAAAGARRSPSPGSFTQTLCGSFAFAGQGSSISPVIVALGTSTGGPKALQEILPLLPRDLSVPILIVQHMPPGFTAPFAHRLNSLCSVAVHEAVHREPIRPGVAYIAPAGRHMTVHTSEGRAFIWLDVHPGNFPHIPSVDVMMRSVAETYKGLAMGVIMTGMGCDGAEGMKAIQQQGGLTIGQDEATCAVYGMPRACAELGTLSRMVPLSQIPAQILQATHYHQRV